MSNSVQSLARFDGETLDVVHTGRLRHLKDELGYDWMLLTEPDRVALRFFGPEGLGSEGVSARHVVPKPYRAGVGSAQRMWGLAIYPGDDKPPCLCTLAPRRCRAPPAELADEVSLVGLGRVGVAGTGVDSAGRPVLWRTLD